MRKTIITLVLIISTFIVYSQQINNIKVDQDGGEIKISYTLSGNTDESFEVILLNSADGKKWDKITEVTGDIGDTIKAGANKKIGLWADQFSYNEDKTTMIKLIVPYLAIDSTESGLFKDKSGATFAWKKIGKTRWILKTYPQQNAYFSGNDALKACPEGWELPTDEIWQEMETSLGMDEETAKTYGWRDFRIADRMKEKGFELEANTYSSGMYSDKQIIAFWTSTPNKFHYWQSDKFYARFIDLQNGTSSRELRPKTEEYNIFCTIGAVYKDTTEATQQLQLKIEYTEGKYIDPLSGEDYTWRTFGNQVWMLQDILGLHSFYSAQDICPPGWKLPNKKEWNQLIENFRPSGETFEDQKIINKRLSTSGPWGFNLSPNEYWIDVNFYIYQTFWINNDDKKDSRKLMDFPSNDNYTYEWVEKKTSEKGKVRCVNNNPRFLENQKNTNTGTFVDEREDKEYTWVEIDGKKWMSRNLNFKMFDDAMCRNDNPADCKAFGRMYNWKSAETICPEGWRLPSLEEWEALVEKASKAVLNINDLYSGGKTGFNMVMGGPVEKIDGSKIYSTSFWYLNGEDPGFFKIDSKGNVTHDDNISSRKDFFYVRCVKK